MTKSKKLILSIITMLIIGWITSCTEVDIAMPKGPKGDTGLSAYEFWKEMVAKGEISWPTNNVEVTDYFKYLKGKDGKDGKDGLSAYESWKIEIATGNIDDPHNPGNKWPKDRDTEKDFWDFLTGASGENGQTPHIGENNNWWIGNHDTGVPAKGKDGKDGKDGKTPIISIGENGNWFIDGEDTGKQSAGRDGFDGKTPTIEIGENGNWFIDGEDTGKQAIGYDGKDGIDGKDGQTPVLGIGENGNWYINGEDTGTPATGADGKDGKDGKTPTITISDEGNWVIDGIDTGKSTKGADGKDGKNSTIAISDKGTWVIDGVDTNVKAYGSDGEDGESAYEMWKKNVEKGTVEDPKNPGEFWPTDKTTVGDFYEYLTGADGADGTDGADGADGKSAYEVWKELVEKGCSGEGPVVVDPKDPTKSWCGKTTKQDYYDYLRGKDGEGGTDGTDGTDGFPGIPGKPGAEVTIIKGIPNVIAQYSQSEFGEYVRTTDGGVLYHVYDKQGVLAPNATVKGMPGLPADKTYTSDSEGKFIIPKEDLPEIQAVLSRWGTVKEVTIGEETMESAKNTYVPNRVHMRMVPRNRTVTNYSYQQIYWNVQRRLNPEDEWENLPTYLPNIISLQYDAYRLSDSTDPNSIISTEKISTSSSSSSTSGFRYYYSYVYRYMVDNKYNIKNSNDKFWDNKDVYYTVKARKPYYGEDYKWNGVAFLPPHQVGPTLKTLKLKRISEADEPSFQEAEGEFDFSDVDMTKMYKYNATMTEQGGVDFLNPEPYTEAEAKELDLVYVKFVYRSQLGTQTASSNNNLASFNNPVFRLFGPFLGSSISVGSISSTNLNDYAVGKLKKGVAPNTYVIEQTNPDYPEPTTVVTYEE